jgi:hypothetical protein
VIAKLMSPEGAAMTDSMATDWYHLKNGAAPDKQVGPLSWEQLRSLGSSGSLRPDDLVWNPALPEWVPAGQIAGLLATRPEVGAASAAALPAVPPTVSSGRRHSRLLSVLIPLIALIVVGGGLGAYFGFLRDGNATVGDGSGSTVSSQDTGDSSGTTTTAGSPQTEAEREKMAKVVVFNLLDMVVAGNTSAARALVAPEAQGSLSEMVELLLEPYGYTLTSTAALSSDTFDLSVVVNIKAVTGWGDVREATRSFVIQVKVNDGAAVVTAITPTP